MKLGHRSSWFQTTTTLTLAVVFFQSVILLRTASALSINKREPVTEQVLIITTQTESPQDEFNDDVVEFGSTGYAGSATTPPAIAQGLVLSDSEQSDQAGVSTTVDTIIVQDTTSGGGSGGESWEVDPTSSSIISKDVEIEIATSENSNKVMPQGDSAASGGASQEIGNSKPVLPEIYSFHVESNIQYRYSRTLVTSRVANKDLKRAQEVTFSVVLPETAFISKFVMEIDGKAYEAYVKEKEEAKKDYIQAQSQGQTAGLVEKSTRNSNVFNVNVNVKPQTKVTFNLTYEELLSRRLGRYEQAININPDQVSSIQDYQIVVNIEESRNLTFVRVPSLSNDIDGQSPEGNNPDAVIERPAANKAKISWRPNTADQKKLVKEGISGKFLVQYDVNRESDAGQILVMQGYFVHFFAPENLPPLKKHVVFILDISGSMWGRKMEQLKESQTKILDDLSSDDFFNIITFSSDVYLWSPKDTLDTKRNEFRQPSFPAISEFTPPELLARKQPLPATPENINKAKAFIDSLVASGGTNIHDAIIEALNLTAAIKQSQQKPESSSSSTEPEAIETTILPVYSPTTTTQKSTTSTTVATTKSEAPSTTTSASTTSTTTTQATSSTTQSGTDDDDENRTVDIIDVARNDLPVTETPEESSTSVSSPSSSPGQVILPPNVQSLIIFLTDGEPTVGITDPPEIQKLIQAANRNLSIPIFSLGFGEGADFPFLKKLSLQNYGFGRKIYEASDAALQLKGFYNEIASPLLSNVTFNYTSENYNITDVTVTRFPTVFGGTEIAVAGKLVAPPKPERDDDFQNDYETTIAPSHDAAQETTQATFDDETPGLSDTDLDTDSAPPNRLSISCDLEQSDRYYFDVSVEGIGRDGEVDLSHVEVYERPRCGVGIDIPIFFLPPAGSQFPPRPTPPPTPEDIFLERLWAYLTIQQLIEKDLAGLDDTSSSGNANPEDNSIDDNITPSSTARPEDSSQVTKVLPSSEQGPTTPTPSVRNVTKPETAKEKALRLALKYGFVTPLTSLVVVKPNSSDVTNAVPTDGRPDALDSLYGIQSSPAAPRLSFQAPILNARSQSQYPHSGHPASRISGRRHSSGMSLPTSSMQMPQSMTISYSRTATSGGTGTQWRPNQYKHYGSNRIGFHSRGSGKKASAVDITSQSASTNSAPQSMSLALAAPAFPSGIRNKIAYSPLPVPISSNYNYARPVPPIPLVGGPLSHGPPPALGFGSDGGSFGGPPSAGFSQFGIADDYDLSSEQKIVVPFVPSPVLPEGNIQPTLLSTTVRTPVPTSSAPASTSSTPTSLTLSDISWLDSNIQAIHLNETDYMIARNQTSDDNEGYGCTNSMNNSNGECRHLQSCVLPAFTTDRDVLVNSYLCGIQSTSSSSMYLGVCCPSTRRSDNEQNP